MSESLEDYRPGEPPLTMEVPSGKARPDTVEKTPAKSEKIDPESEQLPGNTGWTASLSNSVEKRIDRAKLWATTLVDRANSTAEAIGSARGRLLESTMNKRSNSFFEREKKHSTALMHLEARSGKWNLPIFRSITSAQTTYHSWREKVNQRKASRADAKAERAGKRAETAEEFQKYFDGKIASRVDVVTSKWQRKLDAVRAPREKIDSHINELTESLIGHEALVDKMREKATKLENTAGGNRSERRNSLRSLHTSIAREEMELERVRDMMGVAQKNRTRFAVAEDSSEGAIESFNSRYKDHGAWEKPESSATGDADTASPAPDNPITQPMLDLIESKGEISNNQIGKLWDKVFIGAKLPEGFKSLTKMLKSSFPAKNFDESPEAKKPIKEFFKDLRELYKKSDDFQQLTRKATGQRGEKGIDILVGRLETRVAYSDSLEQI